MVGHGDARLRQVDVDRAAGDRGDRARGSNCRCRSRSWRRIIAVLIAIPLGTLAALFRDTWIDYVVRIFTIGGLSIPSFWFGMLIMLTLLALLQLAAADHLHADLRRSDRQPDAADLAGARGRLPLLRGGGAHDPLLAARSAATRTTSAPPAPRACTKGW